MLVTRRMPSSSVLGPVLVDANATMVRCSVVATTLERNASRYALIAVRMSRPDARPKVQAQLASTNLTLHRAVISKDDD